MARRRGQIIITWDPEGVIGDLRNDYTVRHGIETARIGLPQNVRFGDLPNLVVAVGQMLRKVLWPETRNRKALVTGFEIPSEPAPQPHHHADGTVHSHAEPIAPKVAANRNA